MFACKLFIGRPITENRRFRKVGKGALEVQLIVYSLHHLIKFPQLAVARPVHKAQVVVLKGIFSCGLQIVKVDLN